MKSKIIALLLAAICLVALFSACDNKNEETTEAPTQAPTEEPTTEAPTEEETETFTEEVVSEMIVNPMPESGEMKDYLDTKYESYMSVINTIDQVNVFDSSKNMTFYDNGLFDIRWVDLVQNEEGVMVRTRHIDIYNIYTEKKIFTYTSNPFTLSEGEVISCGVEFFMDAEMSYAPEVVKISKCNNLTHESQYDYMTFTGAHIVTAYEELEVSVEYVNGYCYATIGDVVYAIAEDGSIIEKGDELTFVRRPEFFESNDKIAYLISDNNTLYFYNLDKWLDCVYSYDVPGYYESYETFMLQNGNVLVQALCAMPEDTLSYDIYMEGCKYNIDYIMIDPVQKTATSVEFGYMITYVMANDAEYTEYTDKVQNVFWVHPIVNQKVDFDRELELAVTDTLEIQYNYTKDIPALCDYLMLIADNRFITTSVIDADTYIQYIYNEKLEKIATLSANAFMFENYILVGDTIYDMSMNKLIDCVEDEYTICYVMENYVVLNDADGNIYHYDPSTKKLTAIVEEGEMLLWCDEYIISVITLEGKYEIMNAKCEVLAVSEYAILDVTNVADDIIKITFENGEVMFAK